MNGEMLGEFSSHQKTAFPLTIGAKFTNVFKKELWLNGSRLAPNVTGSNPVWNRFLLSRSDGFAQNFQKSFL